MAVDDWTVEPAAVEACADLAAALPFALGEDRPPRDVSGAPAVAVARAWGDPPVVLRCGVPQPPEYRPDSELVTVDDVDWLPVDGSGGVFFTTTGRVANVEVAVPSAYAPQPGVLTYLADAITEHVPLSGRR